VFRVSAKTEEGMEDYLSFMTARSAQLRPAAAV
jgi:hypothetical protein